MRIPSLALATAVALGFGLQPAAGYAATLSSSTVIADPANLTYPERGRGAWSSVGNGGTLSADGVRPGAYYRTTAGTLSTPGYIGYTAMKTGAPVSINDYAVYRGVRAMQNRLNSLGFTGRDGTRLIVDGRWGPNAEAAVKKFQASKGLVADGIVGRWTAKALFAPLAAQVAAQVDPAHATDLARLMHGTISWESGWDPGAVGGLTPNDMGLGQINGPAHPSMNVNDRFDPKKSLPYVASLIQANLVAFDYRLDESIAAYNLGRSGARAWASAGKPQYWPLGTTNDVHRYIDRILNPIG